MDRMDLIFMATGATLAILAALAWLADHLRVRRRNLDRVGLMPWTGIFFFALMGAILLLGLAGRDALFPMLIAWLQ